MTARSTQLAPVAKRTTRLAGSWPLLAALGLLMVCGGCALGPEPRYRGPGEAGRLVYVPGVGITRKGAIVNTPEQVQFALLEKAYKDGDWQKTILLSLNLTQSFPEGSRAVDAILLRIRARLELGRSQDREAGLPPSAPLTSWMFLYLAPATDTRLQRVIASSAANRDYVAEFRALSVQDFVEKLAPDADSLYDSGLLELALADCRILVTYYLPALELREFRHETAELTRDVAWLMYAARAFDAVIEIAQDLLAMNPAPAIKGDALFIEGQAQRRNGAHYMSANTFGLLFSGAGLRDTDTRWRPYALMWQINEIMEASKGKLYDQVPYERAMELLGEYELYALENPNIEKGLHAEFIALIERVYQVMIDRDLNAADTYSRIGESDASDYYTARAEDWGIQRDKRIDDLRKVTG